MLEKRLRLTVDFMLLIAAMEQDDIEKYYCDQTEAEGVAPPLAPREAAERLLLLLEALRHDEEAWCRYLTIVMLTELDPEGATPLWGALGVKGEKEVLGPVIRSLGGGVTGSGAKSVGGAEFDELVDLLRASRKLWVKGARLEEWSTLAAGNG
ncbi:MAG: hypothetical protein ABW250_01355 [Pyrinomonadaceae bacterium]